jgi:hypothetical protein
MPAIKKSLVGGSEGEPELNSAHPFFFPDVKALQLLSKNTYGLRLLPAYDMHMLEAGDENYKLSVAPYRDVDKIDPMSDQPKFTAWYYVLKAYKFVGNDSRHFVSPLTGHAKDNRGIDPLFDIFFTARNSGNPDWTCLVAKPEKASDGYQSVIPLPKRCGVANALVNIEKTQSIENRIIVFGSMCLDMLKMTLNTMRPVTVVEPVDPDWPNYLFGDVTSPARGSWATVKKTIFNTAQMADSGMHFSSKPNQLVGHTAWPIDTATEWGIAALAGRYNIADTEKVTRIWTAEEILDYIVSDGFIPYALIEEGCKKHWHVPPESGNPTYSLPPESSDDDGGQFGPVPSAPAAPVAPAAPAAPVAAAAPVVPRPFVAPPRIAAPAAPASQTPPAPRVAPPVAQGHNPSVPRTAAPGALPPRPAAPASAPKAPAAPGATPRPPSTPKPVVAAPVPVPVVANTQAPLTVEEIQEFNTLADAFSADQSSLTSDQIQRYAALGERVSAAAIQQ